MGDTWTKWVALTSHISPASVARAEPRSGTLSSVAGVEQAAPPRGAEADDAGAVGADSDALRFTVIPRRLVPPGASPAQITQHSMDRTYALGHLLQTAWGGDWRLLLGELQLAFVAFLVGYSLSALEQWKALVALLCESAEGTSRWPDLYHEFVAVLYHELLELADDFFADPLTSDSYMAPCLRRLFRNVQEDERAPPALRRRMGGFHRYLSKRFSWDFAADADADEDGPVVVDDDRGRVGAARAPAQ
jgi:A1 cistron-splicing factor AAR2